MFLIEIKKVAFGYQCCCAIIQCCNCKTPHSGLWNARRYNISYCMSRKKVMPFLCHLQLQHWMGWFPCLFDRCFKSSNFHKSLQNFFQAVILPDKDNFARSGMKTWIKLSFENAFFLVLKFITSSYLNSFVLIELCSATMIVVKTYVFSEFFPQKVIINYFDKKFKISEN